MKDVNTTLVIALALVMLLPFGAADAKLPDTISQTFATESITPERIVIGAPDIAENGAVVPISIEQVLLPPGNMRVTEVWFFDHFRNTPIAHYKLGDMASARGLATRFKLAGTSTIYVIARLSDGSLISGQTYIKVTVGGCGNGGSTATSQYYTPPAYHPSYSNTNIGQPHVYTPNSERYAEIAQNGVVSVRDAPVSTFSVDVDTGSYSNVRRFVMNQGRLPVSDAVRVEEMINYFAYEYPLPKHRAAPFTVTTEVGPTPWNQDTHLMLIGLKGYEIEPESLPPANLVFLIDVSGSMNSPDKLGLLVASLKMLTRQLSERDRISIVVYAGQTGVVLEPTLGDRHDVIISVLDGLRAAGSTNGGDGLRQAYAMAQRAFIPGGINRVLLATDGDFNVGITSHEELIEFVAQQRKSGISLTTLGFGSGNINEKLVEQLANHGNGNYAYIDNLREGRKVLVSQLAGTLYTIARDVKVQVEFNPALVAEYRLIGYENRMLRREDFKNDKVDAGELGAGHSVTALYEIALHGSPGQRLEPLRYTREDSVRGPDNELAFVRLRFKNPSAESSREVEQPVYLHAAVRSIDETSSNFRFAAAVAAFGQLLRGGAYLTNMTYARVHELAGTALGEDQRGHRREFLELVKLAESLR